MNRLKQLAGREEICALSVRPILAAIGAHQLAEEDTLVHGKRRRMLYPSAVYRAGRERNCTVQARL